MPQCTQAYSFKLPGDAPFRISLGQFQDLMQLACRTLLAKLWEESWLDALAGSALKAYKVIDEKQVTLTLDGQSVYLPSRIRRGIAERVGRILRSQAVRKACYYDVLEVVSITGVSGNLDSLVKQVALTVIAFKGKYYKRALIRQTLRTLRRYYYHLGLDPQTFVHIPYTMLVSPSIHTFTFPYAADNGLDGQTIKVHWSGQWLIIECKLPTTERPVKVSDWTWHRFTLEIPRPIYQRIRKPGYQIHLPTMREIVLKGGLTCPVLTFGWSSQGQPDLLFVKNRVMTTDLGLMNLTTSVIIEAGSQLSRPIFWSPSKNILRKIEELYDHIAGIQKKLDRYQATWRGQGRRLEERARLYRKLNRIRKELLHLTCNQLVGTALQWGCKILVLEDLRAYEPPKHQRTVSRKLSNWIRGSLYEVLTYKAALVGIKVTRVNPRGTSSYCPRCGAKGLKITEPTHKTEGPKGRFFYCPHCHYTADRDYIAAVNIFRMYHQQRKKRFSLINAKPVSYIGTDTPPDCSWRRTYSTSVG
ncbi:MAG: RNA-guided endonuclease TnpB family protein [Candidatus Hermodarchaeota archaeon]